MRNQEEISQLPPGAAVSVAGTVNLMAQGTPSSHHCAASREKKGGTVGFMLLYLTGETKA